MLGPKMRFGAFIAPFHPLEENPTLAIERDFELVQWMDKLGYDEAWIGEHHSAAYSSTCRRRGQRTSVPKSWRPWDWASSRTRRSDGASIGLLGGAADGDKLVV
jgi:alkanesulfonate monooxygenase SsuD/methylene tetrahydromethanopterin reductase-like flavin-dependent oxidoreductase (luciferase family)